MIYNYKAVSNKGEIIKGSYEGKNPDEVLDMLKDNNYLPISIKETKNKNNFFLKSKVHKKDISIFCRQFYIMLTSGISIVECLEILEKQTENKVLKKNIGQVCTEVQRGKTLSQAMKAHKKIFPILLINMVQAGEISGTLDIVLKRMAIYYEKENKIEKKIKGAMIYPVILIIVSTFVVIFLLTMVLPTFIDMFKSNDIVLPISTRILLKIGNCLKNYWYFYMIFLLFFIIGINYYNQTQSGRLFFDKIKLKFPGMKKVNSKIITSRFTRTLSTLLSSGIPLIQSLKVANKVIGNEIITNELEKSIQNLERGLPLWKSIEKINVFSPMVISMISIGEESGFLDEMFDKVANFCDEEINVSLEKLTTIIEPVLIVIMAFIIGFIVIAMAMPMFDMVNIM